jgi:hypothetical protein
LPSAIGFTYLDKWVRRETSKEGIKLYALVEDQGQRYKEVEDNETFGTQSVRQDLDGITKKKLV